MQKRNTRKKQQRYRRKRTKERRKKTKKVMRGGNQPVPIKFDYLIPIIDKIIDPIADYYTKLLRRKTVSDPNEWKEEFKEKIKALPLWEDGEATTNGKTFCKYLHMAGRGLIERPSGSPHEWFEPTKKTNKLLR